MSFEDRTRQSVCKKVIRQAGLAVARHRLIEEGDHILVGVSGGKDSYSLLDVLFTLMQRAPVRFRLTAFHLDQRWAGHDPAIVRRQVEERWSVPLVIEDLDVPSILQAHLQEGRSPCSLCSRLRRGMIYSAALRLGCNKVALGHHADDLVETLLLNMFFNGSIKAFPAALQSERGPVVIRPLVGVWEEQLTLYAEALEVDVQRCNCPQVVEDSRRVWVKETLLSLRREHAGIKGNLLASAANVMPRYLLQAGEDGDVRQGGAVDGEQEPIQVDVERQ